MLDYDQGCLCTSPGEMDSVAGRELKVDSAQGGGGGAPRSSVTSSHNKQEIVFYKGASLSPFGQRPRGGAPMNRLTWPVRSTALEPWGHPNPDDSLKLLSGATGVPPIAGCA
ncbi:hypothetical protein AAFF_G00081050 [Aldrovandia affinis]|uniref:Uncharacterized protein n=1 Tax=Aldrovandia affinis TaxID=143900 RepID=A0AAD7T454_9TELE|nr:hypothetical protein AAFF_G00081050 [Aldrovandia affinis]